MSGRWVGVDGAWTADMAVIKIFSIARPVIGNEQFQLIHL